MTHSSPCPLAIARSSSANHLLSSGCSDFHGVFGAGDSAGGGFALGFAVLALLVAQVGAACLEHDFGFGAEDEADGAASVAHAFHQTGDESIAQIHHLALLHGEVPCQAISGALT